ncbi:MAG: hypothetical protein Q8K40_08200, partial [Ignavibacteria bacterium]|nr:hypothetical protein [Ignavibacteria bacterium]
MLGIVSIIIWGCENANEPKDTSNLLTPEITNLKVTNKGVSFSWTNRNTLHIDFEIERKIGDEDYKSIARLDYTYYGLTDSLLPNGVLANYRIRALYKTRTSGYGYSAPVLKCSTALIDSNFHDYYMYHVYKLTNEKFLLIGVKHDAPAQSLLFDPATNQFSNSANLTRSIEGFSFALLDNGNVLLAGSRVGDTHLKQTFLYNVVSNTWSAAADLLYLQTENSSVRMP